VVPGHPRCPGGNGSGAEGARWRRRSTARKTASSGDENGFDTLDPGDEWRSAVRDADEEGLNGAETGDLDEALLVE
jgi:hypothetical protein